MAVKVVDCRKRDDKAIKEQLREAKEEGRLGSFCFCNVEGEEGRALGRFVFLVRGWRKGVRGERTGF